MRKFTKKIRKNILCKSVSELKSHIWFRYHRALFVRLILRGNKIKAFNKLLDLKNRPDGIFASGDIMATSAIQCAKRKGIKIPEELAIIGFNNDPISQIIDPNLSTISHPAEKMGQMSAEIILSNIKSPNNDHIKEITFFNTEVLVRESSRKYKTLKLTP